MSDPFERVKGGRLAFKGGTLATRTKTIDKKKKNKKKKDKDKNPNDDETLPQPEEGAAADDGGGSESGAGAGTGEAYTIDAAKRMKYEQLFPVEAKKFGYEPKPNFKSMEDALDDRVKKKADRYCK